MPNDTLQTLLNHLIQDWENEIVEFKDANDNFSTDKIGKYFSALSNEANLRDKDQAWLIFGVDNNTKEIIGTDYRSNVVRLQSRKMQISDDTEEKSWQKLLNCQLMELIGIFGN